jgi:hypothetical protein
VTLNPSLLFLFPLIKAVIVLIPPISLIACLFEPASSRTSQSELKTTSRPHPWESVDSQPAPQTRTSETLLLPDPGTLIDPRDSQTESWILAYGQAWGS